MRIGIPILSLDIRRALDQVVGKIQLACGVIVVLFGMALKAPVDQWLIKYPLVGKLVDTMQVHAWYVVVAGPLAIAVLQFIRRKWGNPWAWEALQKTLDNFRHDVFAEQDEDPQDHHRVTLYRFCSLAWGWPPWQWLVPKARSGHLTRRNICRFRTPDDPRDCQGIVGVAWRCKGWVIIPKGNDTLPNLE